MGGNAAILTAVKPESHPTALWRQMITYGLFPVGFGACMIAMWNAYETGFSATALLVMTAISVGLSLAVIERVHPAYAEWNSDHGDVPTDLAHALVSQAIVPALIEGMIPALVLALTTALPLPEHHEYWPHHWHVSAQVVLAIVISQFFEYWFHRLCHTTPWLWRLHATHHSPERLYFPMPADSTPRTQRYRSRSLC